MKIKALKKLRANVFRFFKGFITFFIMIENSSIDSYQLVNRMHFLISNHDNVFSCSSIYTVIIHASIHHSQQLTILGSLKLNFQSTPTVMLVVYWSNFNLFGDLYNQFTTSKKGSTRYQGGVSVSCNECRWSTKKDHIKNENKGIHVLCIYNRPNLIMGQPSKAETL